MADEKEGIEGNENEFTNLKAEFNRKIGNVVDEVKKQNDLLLAEIAKAVAPKAPSSEGAKTLKDKWWDNPDEAAAEVQRRTEDAIEKKLSTQNALTQKQTAMINSLTSSFPELTDGTHALTKRALDIYNAMDPSEKTNPLSYDAAVKTAALEEGIKPMHKRTDGEREAFSMGSNGSSAAKRSKDGPKLTDNAVAFARVMGLNMDDKKTVDRLKKRIGRDYSKPSYE